MTGPARRVAVAGGTGAVGRLVVGALRTAGHQPVTLSRGVGVDVVTGAGVARALTGCDAVIDVSNRTTLSRRRAEEFFLAGTASLLREGRRAGVGHHVLLSIVGVDRVPLGYYRAKLAQERAVLGSGAPVTVLRATQFHEFAEQSAARVRGPVVPVARLRCRPVAAVEVARALVDVALGEPLGRAPELAGPREEDLVDLVRRLLGARGRRRLVLPVPLPGAAGRAVRAGGLLPTADGPRGRIDFTEWLAG